MLKLLKMKPCNNTKLAQGFSTILLALQLAACASTQNTTLSIVYEHTQCGYAEPGIIALPTDKQYTQLVNRLLPFHAEPDKVALNEILSTHQVDQRLYLLAQGSKPTPGYGFTVLADKALIEDKTLYLPIRFTEPDKGMMMAQVITSPCLILGVDKSADFQRIEAGSLRLEIN